MAINFLEKPYDKINSNTFKENNSSSSQLLKNILPVDNNESSGDVKVKSNKNARSPYLFGDSVQLLSRLTEKKLVHKKAAKVSSFPLAVNIYKASSDEFKAQKKSTKSVKKSVLTLPNVPAQIPQACTVSDMNDSEYLKTNTNNNKLRNKKCFAAQNRKAKVRNKGHFERDCSQLNISTDEVTGDSKKKSKHLCPNKTKPRKEFSAHDMWTVLRNINKFQFRPSPPMSDDSILTPKKNKSRNKRRNNRKDTRVVETCRTEEFAYISSFEIDNKSPPSFSQSLSFDRITVIDKQDEFKDMCKQIGRGIENGNILMKNEEIFTNKNFSKGFDINDKALTYKNNNHMTSMKKNYNGRKLLCDKTEYLIKGNMIEYSIGRNNRVGDVRSKKSESNLLEDHNEDFNEICDQSNVFDDIPTHSLQSGSSKVYGNHMTMAANEHTKRDNANVIKVASYETAQNMKGITKVILSKNLNSNPNYNEILKKRPNVAAIQQNTNPMPKLTQAEIRRRLANMKFPIIILGKDQLATTSLQISNNKDTQFDGLDKQIWPFMKEWYAPKNPTVNRDTHEKHTKKTYVLDNNVKSKQISPSDCKHKNISEAIEDKTNKDANNNKKYVRKPLKPSELSKIHIQQPIRPKPVQQLTDKMIQLLYKNSSVRSIDTGHGDMKHNDNNISTSELKKLSIIVKADASTETTRIDDYISESNKSSIVLKKPMIARYPWARGKFSSDFVDNVINKLRNGVYYNEEDLRRIAIPIDRKEVSVQTSMSDKNIQVNDVAVQDERIVKDNKSINCFELASMDCIDTLPVFGESPPPLEIKTLNRNELSIKHCTTNVMLQFDVTISMESEIYNPLTKNSSFIPLSITESHTKIFKCKTTILNAMLPAEICSVLPKLLKTIVDLNKQSLLPLKSYQNDTTLYKISEMSRSGSMELFQSAIPPVIGLSLTLTKFMEGMYAHKLSQIRKKGKCKKLQLILGHHSVVDVLPSIRSAQGLVLATVDEINPIMHKSMSMPPKIENKCTALELYKAPTQSITEQNIPLYTGTCSITKLIEQMWNQKFTIRYKMAMPLNIFFERNDKIVNMQVDNVVAKITDSSSINQLQIDPLFSRCSKSNGYKTPYLQTNSAHKAIEYKQSTIKEETSKKDIRGFLRNTKTRKKSFIKLYKKCKSTSNIAGEKYSTSLSKITNLDDFFQVLGSGKMLSSVFDGHVGKKILSAILDMKNWITDISQRQAMLVLLLINKKDTPNIVRFRPILLQGIAVNRITRASELDMEIEVIERENFNKFIQYDGIPYLPESMESQGNLMEELYWIAKTTASDYQKPFNESSERLLRSLLEKRKKLNPSYLRVMARYVGLGLLKEPVKK